MADMDYCVVGAGFAGPPGVLTEFGPALREPCGRIHWAGTESSTVCTDSSTGPSDPENEPPPK